MPRTKAPARKRKAKPKTRRASGTGALFFSAARGVWIGRVAVGKRPDGSPLVVERSHAEQAEVVRRLKEAAPPGPEVTVAEYAARWLKEMRLRERTVDARRNSVDNHIAPLLGGTRVCDLTTGQVERTVRVWSANVPSPNTVRLILDHLGALMSEAVREGLRPDNPVRAARRPKAVRKKIDPFTAAELRRIVAEAPQLRRGRVVALLAATGLRVGEALALDVADYDPRAKTIAVTKTQSIKGTIGPPKSANGTRVVRVPDAAVPAVEAALAGRAGGPLFASAAGGRGGHVGVLRAFDAVQRRLGLRRRNPHQLRHSVATHAIAAGVPIGNVARDLGDTPETVVRTYLHATPDGAGVAEAMGELLSGARVGAAAAGAPE